ncbi:MAG: heavy-metal-associated domain-containing protein [Demequinaceae bacterium]|nr:heavy-metal-associated domain-containing protein [Demequinaceae bacterium]
MNMKQIDLPIGGMSCHHCVMTITQGIKELDGVADASVDLAAKRATVHPDGTVDLAALKNALRSKIEELGYEVIT